ncbi:hypothetical protein ACMSDR_20525 [Bacteroides thetaiotaomicron]|jgi:hypothetical protein|uniref:hypothetical protein n=1 Tax=Bacteroides thetaiotaomicron TaxID=818 RepID=UPI0020563A22|nr:MAG TPA: hypothetical protein [Caudoviricetes sp.]
MDKVSPISKIEVVRFETTYDNGTLDFHTENVRALCKAFSFNFKIIDQYLEGADVRRYYEIYISTSSFFFEDCRHVIKTFILTCGMSLMYTKMIEMDDDDFLNMPEETFEVENLIVYTPKKKTT